MENEAVAHAAKATLAPGQGDAMDNGTTAGAPLPAMPEDAASPEGADPVGDDAEAPPPECTPDAVAGTPAHEPAEFAAPDMPDESGPAPAEFATADIAEHLAWQEQFQERLAEARP